MFIRRTKIGTAKNGKTYYTYRLVNSVREGKKARQRTLLNLGRHFAIEKEHWGLVCTFIKNRLSGHRSMFMEDIPEEVETEANRIAFRVLIDKPRLCSSQVCRRCEAEGTRDVLWYFNCPTTKQIR